MDGRWLSVLALAMLVAGSVAVPVADAHHKDWHQQDNPKCTPGQSGEHNPHCDDAPEGDSDADGVPDDADKCPGWDDGKDLDADGIPDGCDDQDNRDSDGDGVQNWQDVCGDTDTSADATRFPGAPETADDSIDQDCDGFDLRTWYEDADGDTFGNASSSTTANAGPTGHVADRTDCDDGDASIFPGAAEVPDDGIDQDCDGFDLRTWYEDADGDGSGNASSTVTANEAAAGYVATGGDCDDSDASVAADCTDADGDGVYAATDCDDSVAAVAATCTDADGDGIYLEAGDCDDSNAAVAAECTDADGDGTYAVEDCDDANPAWAADCTDTDGDGILDVDDVCAGHDDSVDTDADGTPDGCDDQDNRDSDGDGIQNHADQCPATSAGATVDATGCEPAPEEPAEEDPAPVDTDGDGVPDAEDVCEGHDDNADLDADGIPDGCDDQDNRDSDGDGVENHADQCPGFDDHEDVDADSIPDECDPEVTILAKATNSTGTTSTETTTSTTSTTAPTTQTKYTAVESQPKPNSTYTLGDGSVDAPKADLLKTATAKLKNESTFNTGDLANFRLQVITREAPPEQAGGEVNTSDLKTRVKTAAKTVIVDVTVSGTLKGAALVSPKEVVEQLDLTFTMPASHFADNDLEPEDAQLHEYSHGTFVRTLKLSKPVLEGDVYVYQILLKDFSSFVFEAATKVALAPSGGGGGGWVQPTPVVTAEAEPAPAAPAKPPVPPEKTLGPLFKQPAGKGPDAAGVITAPAGPKLHWIIPVAAFMAALWGWTLVVRRTAQEKSDPLGPEPFGRSKSAAEKLRRAVRLALVPTLVRLRHGKQDTEARRVAELKALLHPRAR